MDDVPAAGPVVGAGDGGVLLVLVVGSSSASGHRRSRPGDAGLGRRRRRPLSVLGLGGHVARSPVVGSVSVSAVSTSRSLGASLSVGRHFWNMKRTALPKAKFSRKIRAVMRTRVAKTTVGVVDHLGAVRPGDLAQLVTDLPDELRRARSASVGAAAWPALVGRPTGRGDRRPPSGPGAASCAWSRGSRVGSDFVSRSALLRLRAGQEGLEPPTAGFGDRCSTS